MSKVKLPVHMEGTGVGTDRNQLELMYLWVQEQGSHLPPRDSAAPRRACPS